MTTALIVSHWLHLVVKQSNYSNQSPQGWSCKGNKTFPLSCFDMKGEAMKLTGMWCVLLLPCRRKPAVNRPVSISDSAAGHRAAPELQTHTAFRGGEGRRGRETTLMFHRDEMKWFRKRETWCRTEWAQNDGTRTGETKNTTEKTSGGKSLGGGEAINQAHGLQKTQEIQRKWIITI